MSRAALWKGAGWWCLGCRVRGSVTRTHRAVRAEGGRTGGPPLQLLKARKERRASGSQPVQEGPGRERTAGEKVSLRRRELHPTRDHGTSQRHP